MEIQERRSSEVSSGRFSALMVTEKVTICLYLTLLVLSLLPIETVRHEDDSIQSFRTYTLLITLINSELSRFSFKCLFIKMGSTHNYTRPVLLILSNLNDFGIDDI